MAGDTILHIVGTICADPELRFVKSGDAVANFTVASNSRKLNKDTGKWEDGEALFMRCNIWRDEAENVAESLRKGHRVMVSGRLKQRQFETKEGEKRTVIELDVDEIGPSLKWARAVITKQTGGGNGGSSSRSEPAASGGGFDEPPFFHRDRGMEGIC